MAPLELKYGPLADPKSQKGYLGACRHGEAALHRTITWPENSRRTVVLHFAICLQRIYSTNIGQCTGLTANPRERRLNRARGHCQTHHTVFLNRSRDQTAGLDVFDEFMQVGKRSRTPLGCSRRLLHGGEVAVEQG